MKEEELRECAVCDICNEKIGSGGNINFYRVNVKSYVFNLNEMQRQDGLAMFLGSPALARVMGSDEDMAKLTDENTITVCADCITAPVLLTALSEDL